MPVTVAKHAGFCYGVERAVNMLQQAVDSGCKVSTLGPIIHNPQIVEGFVRRGVKIIDDVQENPAGYQVVIRSHGVGLAVYDKLRQDHTPYLDVTCPYVVKIHKIVQTAAADGKTVLIAGDRNHPEIQGIIGHCGGEYFVFSGLEELRNLAEQDKLSVEKPYILLAQTTFNLLEWQKCVEFAKNVYTKLLLFDTICNATMLRQQEAEEMSRNADCMIVVGGKGSSNTAKLSQICGRHCRTVSVETAGELAGYDFMGARNVGVTAGASTPAFIIKEVQTTMSEILNQQNQQDEMSFEEMLEQSFKTIYSREKVNAIVTGVSANELSVDIGTKHAGYVPLNEFTDDPNAKLDELVKVGDELELMVLRVNDVEGTAMLSKKRLDAIAGFEKVMEAEQSGEILEGIVVDVVKGGVIALTNGVRVFIPASQATASRGQELETLLKQPVQFKILETNKQRRRAVASIRAVLKEQRKVLEDKFWEDVEIGRTYQGTVKSLTSYGAFVDLGGVDGMVHISELAWSRIKHPSEVVNVGDLVEVYVKDIDAENRKISLGYKKNEDNPWEVLKREHNIGDVCKVKVVSMTPFGAFAQVIPGVDGLIHISQISNERVGKPADVLSIGEEVDVKITDIDYEKRRVSLSIRALLASEEPQEDHSAPMVYEAGPDAHISGGEVVVQEEAAVEEPTVVETEVEEPVAEEAPVEEQPAPAEETPEGE